MWGRRDQDAALIADIFDTLSELVIVFQKHFFFKLSAF